MLFPKNKTEKVEIKWTTENFNIQAQDARLFVVAENMYVITEFDISAVANNYDEGVMEAFDRILEAHNITEDQIVDIVTEMSMFTKDQLKSKIREYEEAKKDYTRNGNKVRANILSVTIARMRKQLADMAANSGHGEAATA